jgi:predicted Fe-Mo cluster-binding NifX family protein
MENKKIAITSDGPTLDSMVDQRFGRCRYFLVVELAGKDATKVDAVENQGAIQGHGAGIRAAQQVGELGVSAVITGDVGPNATSVLSQLKIATYHASGPAKQALESYTNNELKGITDLAEPVHKAVPVQETGERIFFPLLDNSGMQSRISPHFGHAPFFGLYDVKTKEFSITDNTLSHLDPNKSPVDQIIEAVNPTTVFAHGIGARAIMLFNERGIALKTGRYETVQEAVDHLDELEEQTTDCGHGHRR